MIKGAIFDVDGTILESMQMWYNAGANYLAGLGIEADKELGDTLFSMTLPQGAQYVWDKYELGARGINVDDVCEGIKKPVYDFYATEADTKPGARQLLKSIYEAGIPITIATSTDRQQVEMAMARLGLDKYIGRVYSCTDVGVNKSEPTLFNMAAEFMGTRPEDTWIFEDGLYAIICGRNAGYKTVGFHDAASEADWEEIQQTATIAAADAAHISLDDIRNWED